MSVTTPDGRVTVPALIARKGGSAKISAITAYDFTMARLIDRAGVDVILVGDSLASVIQGEDNTLPVTLDEVVYHSRCVTRGVTHALVVGDMPFLSCQVSVEKALEAAGRLIKEGRVSAVKLEGGLAIAKTIQRLVEIEIPVMGHVGLTPQSYHRMGGHKVQGKVRSKTARPEAGTRERVLADAIAVQEAGAFAVVLEGIPADLAKEITSTLAIPTIGIGAGADCDGQIIVSYDMLGLEDRTKPRFVKRYAELGTEVSDAVRRYVEDINSGAFPLEEHSFRVAKLKIV